MGARLGAMQKIRENTTEESKLQGAQTVSPRRKTHERFHVTEQFKKHRESFLESHFLPAHGPGATPAGSPFPIPRRRKRFELDGEHITQLKTIFGLLDKDMDGKLVGDEVLTAVTAI